MSDLVCPRCKTDKYRNPLLKLMVNLCGHALCDSCVELLFVKGSGACPECGVALRRSGFRVQLFEDPIVEKEVDIRRRILRDYCKRESDFASLRDYNDYLEEVETVVFNLVNNIDIIETNRRIDLYKKDNKEELSSKARPRTNNELLELESILEAEKMRAEMMRLEVLNVEKQEKLRKVKNHEALIDDLMFSETDAKSIVASHKSARANIEYEVRMEAPKIPVALPPAFTSGIGFSSGSSFLPVPKVEEVPLYKYVELKLDFGGLHPPTVEELKSTHSTYLDHIKSTTTGELAGGFHSSIACRRALQDAFADIGLHPKFIRREIAVEVEQQVVELVEKMDVDAS